MLNLDITVANVDAAPGLGGYSVTVAFNPAVVHITSLQDAGFVTSGQNIVICSPGALDNVAGKATAGCTAIPLFGAPGVSTASPVALLHAAFSAVAPGTSPVSLAGSTLSAPDGSTLASATVDGSLTVTGADTTPTPTSRSASPTPARTATATAGAAATPSPQATGPPAGTATASEAERAAGTVLAGALKPPATGTGGGASVRWPFVALLGLAGAGMLAIALALARQHWKRGD